MAIFITISGLPRSWTFWIRQVLYLTDKSLKSGSYANEIVCTWKIGPKHNN